MTAQSILAELEPLGTASYKRLLMTNHQTTRGRLEAMIDYIESNFAGYEDIDRQLILLAPSTFAEDAERQRERLPAPRAAVGRPSDC